MGKTGKWLKSLLSGKKEDKDKREKKEKEKGGSHSLPLPTETRSAPVVVPTSKEKRRWSFRKSGAAAGKDVNSLEPIATVPCQVLSESQILQKRHVMAVAVATAAAADAAVAAAQAAAAVIRLTAKATESSTNDVEEASAVKIQAAFRGYLARKALCALKGLVKLQALVRGHLVRKQATVTLRCMQALVIAQERARIHRIRMLGEAQANPQRQPSHRRSPQHPRYRQSYYDMDRAAEENVKVVQMDVGESRGDSKSRNSYSAAQTERMNHRFSSYTATQAIPKHDASQQVSPSPSALADMSPRACSRHFEELSFATAQSSPLCLSYASVPESRKSSFTLPRQEGPLSTSNDYPFYPSYMANTESSRAKARSQSAPKQRPDSCERPPSRRRQSVEGRNIPRSGRMQRSSSHVGAAINGFQYPWSIKLDKSSTSLKESECGSTSTVLTNTNCCRSLAAYEAYGYR